MKKFLSIIVLVLTGCTTLPGTVPTAGFGSNLPNGLVGERVNGYEVDVIETTGLGHLDSSIAYAVNNYRQTDTKENFNHKELSSRVESWFGIAHLVCVSINDQGRAREHWIEVPSTVRHFNRAVLTTGRTGRAPAIADGIAATLDREPEFEEDVDGKFMIDNIRLIMVVDIGNCVIVQERRLNVRYVLCASVRTAEEANRFLAANLMPPDND